MNQRLKISIARGGCRFATPLYLGSSYVLSFEGARADEAKRVLFVKPLSQNPDDTDGIVGLAESAVEFDGLITLSLNRNALVEWFKSNRACDVDATVDAHCYVFNEQGDCLADSPVTIEYSPKLFVIDNEDYPLAREVLSQATSAKNQAVAASDSAVAASDSAVAASHAAKEASSSAIKAAEISSAARDEAVTAKNTAQDAQRATEENAVTVETALGRMIASATKVVGGVEVLLWSGKGDKPTPIFIPNGVDGVTGYVMCDEDGKYYRLKCKGVDGEKVLALEQVGVDDVYQEGYVRAVNGLTPDRTGNVILESIAKLAEARIITLSGGVTGSVSFDGSQNVTLIVTVKDDSHNHIISNVDGLQDALDNKSDKSHTHDYLPLTGGTVGGIINFAINNDQKVFVDANGDLLVGGNGGGMIRIRGENSDVNPSGFQFRAGKADGENVHLIGMPDGTLTWDGKEIVRLVETWKSPDGLSWYRKYSDGWIEQGGYASSSSQEIRFTYPVPFPSRDYSLQVTSRTVGKQTNYNGGVIETTTTGCTFNSMIGKQSSAEYYVCGYVE